MCVRFSPGTPFLRWTVWRAGVGVLLGVLAQWGLGAQDGAPPQQAADAVVAAANSVRRFGCAGRPGQRAPLRAEPGLDAAATQLQRGRSLEDALAVAGYPVVAATSIRIGVRGRDARAEGDWLRDVLAQRFCGQLASADYAAIGTARDRQGVWLVIASPFAPPSEDRSAEVTAQVLALVNAARAQGRKCGDTQYDAAPALARSAVLDRAAVEHAHDLVVLGRLAHQGSNGGRAGDRITRQGYAWSSVAENLASGAASAEEVVAGWFNSPAHCANIMSPHVTETGIAYVLSAAGAGEIYWVQVFAEPYATIRLAPRIR